MEVRHVTSNQELEMCFEVREKVFVEEQKVPRDVELDEFDDSPESCRHFVVLEEGRPIGTGRWRMYDDKTAKLQRIAVLESHRGQGLGRVIIHALENDVRGQGVPAVILDGQVQAEPFYRKLGYEVISKEPFLDAGILHVRMRKSLQ
ncbi:GNAT family N-acetyltransferase [Paenibacillus filicis]|uniref:GNAT family N-acetyltransferase n=1 Tax=Paenibacillus gyeongsangnamensis TaxID=3388067 RepID=A0ABT4QBW6_9BACL|nr:GNAT family N-acetyltransferase [Paenibacillus filicis]MCZ8514180.1 GNAT family N-acetyltransferase [Paenibacillus filicis]